MFHWWRNIQRELPSPLRQKYCSIRLLSVLRANLRRAWRALNENIGDLSKFIRFIKLCAGRIGQLLNLSSLANECGVAVSTISAWISVLEASYLCYLLKPDYNNYAKRLVKTPKLYFYDTGLACSLLDIRTPEQVSTHFLRGGLFENMVINEFIKSSYNRGEEPSLTFWRDSTGNEVDLMQYVNGKQYAYEIKSGATFSPDFLREYPSGRNCLAQVQTNVMPSIMETKTCKLPQEDS